MDIKKVVIIGSGTMGSGIRKVCLYCNTEYVLNQSLSPEQTIPEGCHEGFVDETLR